MEFGEQKLKKLLIEQRKEYQNYLSVMAEDFGSKLQLVAESASGIQEQLIALRDMVAKNTTDITVMKADLRLIKHDLKQKVDQEEFSVLEKRVAALEDRV